MRGVAAAVAVLLLGAVVGLSAVWTHARWGTLGLGAAATLAAELAAPRGKRRLLYAGGWIAVAAYFLLARPEGDFVVASDPGGYAFIALGLVVLTLAVATVPPRRRVPEPPAGTP